MDLVRVGQNRLFSLEIMCQVMGHYGRGEQALQIAAEVAELRPDLVCVPVCSGQGLPIAVFDPKNRTRVLVIGYGHGKEDTKLFLPSFANQAAKFGLFEVVGDVLDQWLEGCCSVPFKEAALQTNWKGSNWQSILYLIGETPCASSA